jgi:hypothetical protein
MDYEVGRAIQKRFISNLDSIETNRNVTGVVLEISARSPFNPTLKVPSQFFQSDQYAISYHAIEVYYLPPISLEPLLQFALNSLTVMPLEDSLSLTPRVRNRWRSWHVERYLDLNLPIAHKTLVRSG